MQVGCRLYYWATQLAGFTWAEVEGAGTSYAPCYTPVDLHLFLPFFSPLLIHISSSTRAPTDGTSHLHSHLARPHSHAAVTSRQEQRRHWSKRLDFRESARRNLHMNKSPQGGTEQ